MQTVVAILIRLLLLVGGLLFAASLAVVVTLVVALWGVRYAWARLTGRPVAPFVVRIDPPAGFGRVYRRPERDAAARPAEPMRHQRPEIGDVTDVEPKS